MTERDRAIELAQRVLDRAPSADPDDDLAILARQFLRETERMNFLHEVSYRTGDGIATCTRIVLAQTPEQAVPIVRGVVKDMRVLYARRIQVLRA